MATNAEATAGERVRLDFDLEQGRVSAERVPQELDSLPGCRGDTPPDRDLRGPRWGIGSTCPRDQAFLLPMCVAHSTERSDTRTSSSLVPVPDVDPQLASTLSDLARVISGS